MTSAGDALLIQPAARPEAASVRKDVPAADDTGVSFADVLDAETDAADEAPVAATAQPAAAPAPPPAPTEAGAPQATPLGTILAALQTINAEPAAEAANAAASGETAAPDAGTLMAQSEIQTPVTATATLVVAAAVVAPAAPKGVKAADGALTDDGAKSEGDDADAAAAASTLVQGVIAAPAVAEAAPAADATATTETIAPAVSPKGAPEKIDATASDASSSDTSTSAADTKTAQPAAAATTQKTGVQTNAQAEAASAGASAPDAKVDAAQASSSTSSTTSTSMADALVRGSGTEATGAAKQTPALANAPTAVAQVYTRFIERHDGRAQRFEIRLDPVELGQVDVKIEIGADKKVHAVLAAHDSAALGDLMKGQRALEQALKSAGIDLADGGLKFEMSQDSGRGLADSQQNKDSGYGRENTNVWRGFSPLDIPVDTNTTDLAAATRTYRRQAARLDVMA